MPMPRNKTSDIVSYVCILSGIVLFVPRLMIWMMPSFPTGSSVDLIGAIRLFFNPTEPTGVLALIGILVIIIGTLLFISQRIKDGRTRFT